MIGRYDMIDWSTVNNLREEVGAEDFGEVVDLFLEEVESVIARMRETPDPEQLEADLHFLKGSALSFGFGTFSGLCETGERMAGKGQGAQVNLQEIFDAFDVSKAQFLTDLPQRFAA